jgi:hypothetical protein
MKKSDEKVLKKSLLNMLIVGIALKSSPAQSPERDCAVFA